MGKEEWKIKRRVWAYVLTAIVVAATIAGAVLAFVNAKYVVGATLAALTVFSTLCLAAEIVQDNFIQQCEALFATQRFEEENELLQKIKNNHLLFPFMRERFYITAIRNAFARDDLALVSSYIARLRHGDDRLRHGDDRHLQYKTAYGHILMLLDGDKFDEARAEYEDFRTNNEHYAIYQPQLEVLGALFHCLSGKEAQPLPPLVTGSHYPIIKRILSRCGEETAAAVNEATGE